MTEAPAPVTVSLSRSPGKETPRHLRSRRDSAKTIGETPDLKTLARLVLARDILRDGGRVKVSRQPAASEAPEIAEIPAPSWGAAEDERVAIVEHDGRIPRAWAGG